MLISFFRQVLLVSAESTLVALVLLLVRALLWRKIPPRLLYLLWIILIVRLMLPASLRSPVTVFPSVIPQTVMQKLTVAQSSDKPGISQSIGQAVVPGASPASSAAVNTPPKQASISGGSLPVAGSTGESRNMQAWGIAASIWVAGGTAILCYLLAANIFMRVRIKKITRLRDDEIEAVACECAKTVRLRRKVSIALVDRFGAPAEFGWLHPVIFLPPKLKTELDAKALRHILYHEMMHIKRGDMALSTLMLLLTAVNWFNPILWYAYAKMKCDCEISCDADVLHLLESGERRHYGETILSILHIVSSSSRAPRAGAVSFADNLSKRRIMMIAKHKKASVLCSLLAVCVVAFAGCGSLPVQTGGSSAKVGGSSQNQASSGNIASSSAMTDTQTDSSSLPVTTGTQTGTNSHKAYVSVKDFAVQNGYSILTDSGRKGTLRLPSSFTEVLQGEKVGQEIKADNIESSRYGLDFSGYLGKTFTLEDYDSNGKDGGCYYLFGLYDGNKLVGIWTFSHKASSNDLRAAMKFGGLYTQPGSSVQALPVVKYSTLSDFAHANGFSVLTDSGRLGTLKLPSSFSEVVGGEKVGSEMNTANNESKSYGLDFSSYLGKSLKMEDFDTERKDGSSAYLFGLYDGEKLVGVWSTAHQPASSDRRATMNFGGLYIRA